MNIPEYQRIATTRLRLSSHNVAIETGRWSRIQPDQRLCSCGSVQTEEHIVCFCTRTLHIRLQYPDYDYTDLCHFFKIRTLKIYVTLCTSLYVNFVKVDKIYIYIKLYIFLLLYLSKLGQNIYIYIFFYYVG